MDESRRPPGITIKAIADSWGTSSLNARNRIAGAGIQPIVRGGPGRPGYYDPAQIVQRFGALEGVDMDTLQFTAASIAPYQMPEQAEAGEPAEQPEPEAAVDAAPSKGGIATMPVSGVRFNAVVAHASLRRLFDALEAADIGAARGAAQGVLRLVEDWRPQVRDMIKSSDPEGLVSKIVSVCHWTLDKAAEQSFSLWKRELDTRDMPPNERFGSTAGSAMLRRAMIDLRAVLTNWRQA